MWSQWILCLSCMLLLFSSNANPRQWTLSFGTTINPPLMKREVRRIIMHEKYRPPARDHDIALVQFSPRVTFSDEVRRICLPEPSASFPPNSTVYITGFGALYYGGGYLRTTSRPLSSLTEFFDHQYFVAIPFRTARFVSRYSCFTSNRNPT